MSHKLISCAIHDYIEIACTFGYEIKLEAFSGSVIFGNAKTTTTSNDKKEYLILKSQQKITKIELIEVKIMTAITANPYFDIIHF
ncbi:MAG: Rho-binding antiterminator [Thiotrichaceae bacterium]|nr:Rho-binding antiterminator [Thiotrichaceae bacterium]